MKTVRQEKRHKIDNVSKIKPLHLHRFIRPKSSVDKMFTIPTDGFTNISIAHIFIHRQINKL